MRFFRRRRQALLQPPRPRLGGPAETWLNRSAKTVTALHDLAVSIPPGPTSEQLDGIHAGARDAFGQLQELAGQVTVVESAIARIPSPELTERRTRTEHELAAATDPQHRAELERTVEAVAAQLAADARLRALREQLLARMQSAALGLEGLLTRAGEVAIMSGGAGAQGLPGAAAADRITDLGEELDGLRAGLAETNRLTKGELSPPST